jgi:hypothetical protein
MMKHYECKSVIWHQKAWVFDWDIETGEVSGADAEEIKRKAGGGGIMAHPMPWAWEFSKEPLKNKTDMAAIIGFEHTLPDDLITSYPKLEEDFDNEVLY